MVAVYKLFKLGRIDGKYDSETRKLERERVVVSVEYADSINANSQTTGLFYEIQEKETVDYRAIIKDRKVNQKEAKQLKKEGATEQLIDAIEKVVERKNNKKKQQ
jgi:hypothetical protein